MKTISLTLAYNFPKGGADVAAERTVEYLNFAVQNKYKDGLDGQLRRQVGRIQRKLDEALDTKAEVVELEDSEFDLIYKAFTEAKFPVHIAKYANVLEEQLDQVSKS